MKGQSSFEYLVIVSMVITFLIPVWAYVLGVQQNTTDELSLTYANNAVKKITDTADLVYSQGPPAKVTVRVYIPSGIEEVIVLNNMIDLRIRTSSGISDVYDISMAQLNFTEGLNDTLSEEGTYILKIEAFDDVVQVSKA